MSISKRALPKPVDTSLVLPENLPKSLKDVDSKMSDLIYEKYDSVFRRGLIEYKSGTRAQKRHKYKLHNNELTNVEHFVA